jgi:hypothetical protein
MIGSMSPRKKTILAFFVALLVFVGTGYVFLGRVAPWVASVGSKVASELPRIEEGAVETLTETVARVKERIVAPPPIFSGRETPGGDLTVAGTIMATNRERSLQGLPEFGEDAELNAAAEAKVDDLFARQYFEHNSPTGEGPADLARVAGYDYIVIGENLALGNFEDDADLVTAWMNSPGHRANILHDEFTEIGVAVRQGTYQGRTTWIAVQEFGRPKSDCPNPDESMRNRIAENGAKLAELREKLEVLESELKEAREADDRARYNRLADEYNDLVAVYNKLVDATKTLVTTFNRTVEKYNACVGG